MKIISKFKDYYDGAASLSGDTDLTYKRENKLGKLRVHRDEIYKGYQNFSFNYIEYLVEDFQGDKVKKMRPFIVGFCGKLYPGIEIEDRLSEKTSWYDIKSLELHLKEVDHKVHSTVFKPDDRMMKYLTGFFENKDNYQDAIKALTNLDEPVFVINDFHLERDKNTTDYAFVKYETNPKLKSYDFFKVFDAYITFQELYMFLGGKASPEKELIQISDKDKIQQHGFDPKYGFRNTPSKYKKK